jgi:hydroxymethylpyrimidine pyrophosphatase-like HAD family hydrolase
VWRQLEQRCDPAWTTSLRRAVELFCYAVVDRDRLPAGWLAELSAWATARGWRTSLQGRKLYLVPQALTKAAAMTEVARRLDASLTLAAGDSLLDLDLLAGSDRGIHPGHGELADSGWSAPHVACTGSVGAQAGEDICRWFLETAIIAG